MLRYNGTTIGKVYIKQRDQKFTIQILQGNCLAVLVHIRKLTGEELKTAEKGMRYRHTLYSFFANEQHCKNILKHDKLFGGDNVTQISLNMFYKESWKLLKYFMLSGYTVKCYYKK